MVLAVALAFNACGGGGRGSERPKPSDERVRVVEVVREWQAATLDRDADGYCSVLTGRAKGEIIATVAALGGEFDCEASAERIFDLGGEDDFERVRVARRELGPDDVQLDMAQATVRLPSGRKSGMKRAGNHWLVDDPPGD